MISKDDPLKNLYVDKNEVDRLRLFLALKKYLGIDKTSGLPVFFEEFYKKEDYEKLLLYLLYRRAASALGHIDKDEIGISIRDLSRILKIDYNRVKKITSELESVEREERKGRYYVPPENIENAINELSHEDDVYYSTERYTRKIK